MVELALVSIYELTAVLLDAKEGAQSNREQCAYIADRAARIAAELRRLGAGDVDVDGDTTWVQRHSAVIACLRETLADAVEQCKGYGQKGYLRRLAFHSSDARDFDDIVARLDAAIIDLQLGVACDRIAWDQVCNHRACNRTLNVNTRARIPPHFVQVSAPKSHKCITHHV